MGNPTKAFQFIRSQKIPIQTTIVLVLTIYLQENDRLAQIFKFGNLLGHSLSLVELSKKWSGSPNHVPFVQNLRHNKFMSFCITPL